jgi:phosphoglycolate phosphatase-like HAD superfamily hydrolase
MRSASDRGGGSFKSARAALGARHGCTERGYGQEEVERAGAYRVYEDPADLLRHLDEVGIHVPGH